MFSECLVILVRGQSWKISWSLRPPFKVQLDLYIYIYIYIWWRVREGLLCFWTYRNFEILLESLHLHSDIEIWCTSAFSLSAEYGWSRIELFSIYYIYTYTKMYMHIYISLYLSLSLSIYIYTHIYIPYIYVYIW